MTHHWVTQLWSVIKKKILFSDIKRKNKIKEYVLFKMIMSQAQKMGSLMGLDRKNGSK